MSNEDISKEVDSALEDVRKAYRLLWLYQRRIFDICREISKQFKKASFYRTSYSWDSTTYPSTSEHVWRMLPMSDIHFFYCWHADAGVYPNGKWKDFPRKGDYLIDVLVISDTALPNYRGKGEPDPTTFEAANFCESRLEIYIYVNDQNCKEPTDWYNKIWGNSDYPDHNACTKHKKVKGIRIYGYKFNLNEIYNIETITKCVDIFKKNVKRKLGVDL